LRRIVLGLALVASLAIPAATAAKPEDKEKDKGPKGPPIANAEHLATVPAPAGIGANFKKIDGRQYMFATGTAGLYVYDTTDPAAPTPVSVLPLPHYENEDVSLGGNRLLLSGDGSTGGSVLIVVDISDPQLPQIEQVVKMYTFGGSGHTATCIQECKYAWVAGYGTIYVVDLTKLGNAAAPVSGLTADTNYGIEVGDMVTQHEFGWSTHDVQVDDAGIAWVVGGNGTIGFDVRPSAYPVPGKTGTAALLDPTIVARTGSNATGDTDSNTIPNTNGRGDTVNDFIHHNSWRPDATKFRSRSNSDLADSDVRPGELVLVTEEDIWGRDTLTAPGGCESQGSFQTWQVKQFGATSADQGTVTNLDSWTTEFNETITGDENPVTGNDMIPTKGFCSSHYFSARGDVVATAWYEQGIRFLDVSNPRDIEQKAFYLPEGATMWAAYWAPNAKDIVYAVDNTRGVIDVLRYNKRAADSSGAVEAPLPVGIDAPSDAVAHAKFGWACRLAG